MVDKVDLVAFLKLFIETTPDRSHEMLQMKNDLCGGTSYCPLSGCVFGLVLA